MERSALHHLAVWAGLFGFWLVLSGHFDTVHLILGAVSVTFVTALSGRLLYTEVDGGGRRWLTGLPWWRILLYLPWLEWEILKANLQVLKLVLGPMDRVRPTVIRFRTDLESEVSRVTLANSITLTPGTVTLDLSPDGEFLVHAIDAPSADGLLEGTMARKVATTFREGRAAGGTG